MTNQAEYTPPKIWTWNEANGGTWANINRPVSGATHDKELPIGRHPLQLYSLGTPNGVKVTVMLEELLTLGHAGAEYDAWLIKIGDGCLRILLVQCQHAAQRQSFSIIRAELQCLGEMLVGIIYLSFFNRLMRFAVSFTSFGRNPILRNGN